MDDPGHLEDPVAFWEQRHAALDPWRSGGDRGLTPEENYEFYAFRLGRIVELIRRHAGCERSLRVLDAGCGRGHLADSLRRCGHKVVGIDSSPTAIGWAKQNYPGRFEECRLEQHRPGVPYDVVLCVDVLFHVLDDLEWRTALGAFGRYAAAEALLLFTDSFPETRYAVRDYIVHRTTAEYDAVLSDLGFVPAERMPYAFGSNPNQFAAYVRTV